jgi:hypothetical protein
MTPQPWYDRLGCWLWDNQRAVTAAVLLVYGAVVVAVEGIDNAHVELVGLGVTLVVLFGVWVFGSGADYVRCFHRRLVVDLDAEVKSRLVAARSRQGCTTPELIDRAVELADYVWARSRDDLVSSIDPARAVWIVLGQRPAAPDAPAVRAATVEHGPGGSLLATGGCAGGQEISPEALPAGDDAVAVDPSSLHGTARRVEASEGRDGSEGP